MEYVNQDKTGKIRIIKRAAFVQFMPEALVANDSYVHALNTIDAKIQANYPSVTRNALNNCHGDWYEWLLAIEAWKYHVANPSSCVALLLPNIAQYDLANLYEERVRDLIFDLRSKVADATDVELISSNPDFVVVDVNDLDMPDFMSEPLTSFGLAELDMLSNAYTALHNRCSFSSVRGFVSVKTSLRPDRRLQIPHEGSLMKAIYTHIQTREWLLNPPGLSFYAIATAVSEADERALRTVATHSITTVHRVPEAAVDGVFRVNSSQEAQAAFRTILTPNPSRPE